MASSSSFSLSSSCLFVASILTLLAGCAATPSAPEAAASSSSLEEGDGGTATNPDAGDPDATTAPSDNTTICLLPKNHPFNLNGEIWTMSDTEIRRTTVFYWHGVPLTMGGLPARPTLDAWHVIWRTQNENHFSYTGLETTPNASGSLTTMMLDLTGVEDVGAGLTGTLTISDNNGQEETIEIVSSRGCPTN